MTWIIILIVVFVIVTLVLGNTKKANKGGARNPIKGKRILTMNEQPTFLRLRGKHYQSILFWHRLRLVHL